MTLAQLRAFVAAAGSGSFAGAGAELGLAPASVSEVVRRLEQQYGLVLFLRGTRRLSLTSAGHQLLPVAERAVASFDRADATLRAYGELTGGVATFGVIRNAEYYLLNDLAQIFHERHPRVGIRLIGQHGVQVAAAVASGDLEAGIVTLPVDTTGLDVRPLLRDEVVLVTTNPDRYGSVVRALDLGATTLLLYDADYGWTDPTRRQVRDWAMAEGVQLSAAIEVEHVTSALQLASRGVGDTFVSRAVTRAKHFPPELHLVPFSPAIYDVLVSVTRDAGILSPASRELLLLAEEMIRAGAAEGTVPGVHPQDNPLNTAG